MRHVRVRLRAKKVPGSGSIAQESIVLTVGSNVLRNDCELNVGKSETLTQLES